MLYRVRASERSASLPCDDGLDNDLDGLVDFPQDPECNGPGGVSEAPIAPIPSLPVWTLALLAGILAAVAGRVRRGFRV